MAIKFAHRGLSPTLRVHSISDMSTFEHCEAISEQELLGIGTLIRSARRRRGWSQEALADRLAQAGLYGADRNQVSRWERAERIPGPFAREKLALALEIPVSRLGQAARLSRARRRSAGKAT